MKCGRKDELEADNPYSSARKDEITLVFDRDVKWDDEVARRFYLDDGPAALTFCEVPIGLSQRAHREVLPRRGVHQPKTLRCRCLEISVLFPAAKLELIARRSTLRSARESLMEAGVHEAGWPKMERCRPSISSRKPPALATTSGLAGMYATPTRHCCSQSIGRYGVEQGSLPKWPANSANHGCISVATLARLPLQRERGSGE